MSSQQIAGASTQLMTLWVLLNDRKDDPQYLVDAALIVLKCGLTQQLTSVECEYIHSQPWPHETLHAGSTVFDMLALSCRTDIIRVMEKTHHLDIKPAFDDSAEALLADAEYFAIGGCAPCACSERTYQSLLYVAASLNADHCLSALVRVFKDVSFIDRNGDTPLHKAVQSASPESALQLLKSGASVSAQNSNGESPLHIAVAEKNTTIATFLVAKGAPVNARNANNRTPIHYAAFHDEDRLVRLLAEAGADTCVVDCDRLTPLSVAAQYGCAKAVRALIEHGAGKSGIYRTTWVPLHLAAAAGSLEILTALLDAGADIDEMCPRGHTALQDCKAGRPTRAFLMAEGADARCHAIKRGRNSE